MGVRSGKFQEGLREERGAGLWKFEAGNEQAQPQRQAGVGQQDLIGYLHGTGRDKAYRWECKGSLGYYS